MDSQTIRLPLPTCIWWDKYRRVPTPLRSTSPFSDCLAEQARDLQVPSVRRNDQGCGTLVADKWGRCKSNEFDRLGKKVSPGTFGKIEVGLR